MNGARTPLLVAALGGNALLRRGETADAATQRANARLAARALAPLAAGRQLLVTHGNGPQVGLLALERECDAHAGHYPLDVLDAETEGMLGYLIQQELANHLPHERACVTLITQIEVAADDSAFARPGKPIGAVYADDEAQAIAAARGWQMLPDGQGWRRAVASPRPRSVVELRVIAQLLATDTVVICAGGGGVPVVRDAHGRLDGVEAVIDKDAASALLARQLEASALLLLTDVDALYSDWASDRQRALRSIGSTELARQVFAAGSMAPKVAAACEFVEAGDGVAAIGRLEDAEAILAGRAGTRIVAGRHPACWW
jgi:carbamate kinase